MSHPRPRLLARRELPTGHRVLSWKHEGNPETDQAWVE